MQQINLSIEEHQALTNLVSFAYSKYHSCINKLYSWSDSFIINTFSSMVSWHLCFKGNGNFLESERGRS